MMRGTQVGDTTNSPGVTRVSRSTAEKKKQTCNCGAKQQPTINDSVRARTQEQEGAPIFAIIGVRLVRAQLSWARTMGDVPHHHWHEECPSFHSLDTRLNNTFGDRKQ